MSRYYFSPVGGTCMRQHYFGTVKISIGNRTHLHSTSPPLFIPAEILRSQTNVQLTTFAPNFAVR